MKSDEVRVGVYVCHCGLNIATVVDCPDVAAASAELPGVVVSKNYRYMCSDPGQEMIRKDIGFEKMTDAVERPLEGLRVAAHYGFHLLRPKSYLEVDDPVRPVLLDRLIELTVATSVPYFKSNLCCGAVTSLADSDTVKELVRYKLGR